MHECDRRPTERQTTLRKKCVAIGEILSLQRFRPIILTYMYVCSGWEFQKLLIKRQACYSQDVNLLRTCRVRYRRVCNVNEKILGKLAICCRVSTATSYISEAVIICQINAKVIGHCAPFPRTCYFLGKEFATGNLNCNPQITSFHGGWSACFIQCHLNYRIVFDK